MKDYKFKSSKLKSVFLALAILGAAGCVYAFFQDKAQFAYSYLFNLVFFICIALGGMWFVLIQHLTRAGWSVVVRRIAEHVSGSLMWLWILIIPLLFCLPEIFHWIHPEDSIVEAKSAYLNIKFFLIRTAGYFIVWILVSWYLLKKSVEQDVSGDKSITLSLQKWSTIGMIFYVITETFFAFDWIMSLMPHWFSTIFGVYFFSCSAVGIFAFLIIISMSLRRAGYLKEIINVEHYHDLGKLLFGFNMFWAYIAFCQFLLIWYGNLGEETIFYHLRANGSWKTLSFAMPFLHFAVPFFFMISRNVKRNLTALLISSVWLFIVNYLDIYWLIMPNLQQETIQICLADISALLFTGGLFVYMLIRSMEKTNLIPAKDPRLNESLNFKNA